MYYPYLRGKQFELLALREFANKNANNRTIVPIIEPVKNTFNSLRTAIEVMLKQGLSFALVLNPNDGDFKKSLKSYNVLQEIPALLEEENLCKWVPAFMYNNDEQSIIATIVPIVVPSKKPTSVSMHVILKCLNKSFEVKFKNVFTILDG